MTECIHCQYDVIVKELCEECPQHNPTTKQLRRQQGHKNAVRISHALQWESFGYPWYFAHQRLQFAEK